MNEGKLNGKIPRDRSPTDRADGLQIIQSAQECEK